MEYFIVINTNGELVRQLVLPETCIATVMTSLHDDIRTATRHCHSSKITLYGMVCLAMSKRRLPTASNRCIRRKTPTSEKAALINIESSQPLELVCIDYLSLERSNGGYENILVITDHFTRYAIAIPSRN